MGSNNGKSVRAEFRTPYFDSKLSKDVLHVASFNSKQALS